MTFVDSPRTAILNTQSGLKPVAQSIKAEVLCEVLDNILMILLFLEPMQQWGQSVKFVKVMGPQQNIHNKTLGNV